VTLGYDCCVRLWSCDGGEALGLLEQGVAEGCLPNWQWPIDAHALAKHDCAAVSAALQVEECGSEDSSDNKTAIDSGRSMQSAVKAATLQVRSRKQDTLMEKALKRSSSTPELRRDGMQSPSPIISPLVTSRSKNKGGRHQPPGLRSYSKISSKYLKPSRQAVDLSDDWLVGPMSSSAELQLHLPELRSGLRRPGHSDVRDLVKAARDLSSALQNC